MKIIRFKIQAMMNSLSKNKMNLRMKFRRNIKLSNKMNQIFNKLIQIKKE